MGVRMVIRSLNVATKTTALFVIMLIVALSGARAGELVWSDFRAIHSVSLEGINTIFVVGGAKAAVHSSCDNKFRIDGNDPEAEFKVATVNTAYAGGMKVNVSFTSDSTTKEKIVSVF